MSDSPVSAPSRLALRAGLVAAALLMLGALALFYFSLGGKSAGQSADGTEVTVTAKGCVPNAISVPAGKRRFTVINGSERAIEWEILDGVMVLEERENIAPGMHQQLTAQLTPGEYAMTCGLLSNPQGTLTVTEGDGSERVTEVSARALIGPLAEYQVYLTLRGRALAQAAEQLQQQIAAGDLAAAQHAYRDARAVDQQMALAVGLFSDLDQRLNARADYFAQREQDPEFMGFQRLAYGLFEQKSLDGLLPVAEQLNHDVADLRERLRAEGVPAPQLARGAGRVLQAWHDQQQGQAQLSELAQADLVSLQQGVHKVVSLVAPVLEQAHPEQAAQLAEANQALATEVSHGDAQRVLPLSEALAEQLASVNPLLAAADQE
ncbi:MAG TPA: multidrug DMT transporter permease [Pseudomonas sp.]|nr:multidrug DMT transporter permease [Pseudomonadales bacterium]HCL40360.1 multidrug DMT transporter permease [Pseudomonas sp.]|tara:strand:+ start:3699 stop:4832 length:1134 start_codon:yes stop_codon:yes gene_type:complete